VLAAGCIPIEKPDTSIESGPGYHSAAARPAPAVAPDWWRRFGSAELSRLVGDATAGNLDIAAAAARIREADAAATIAGAALLPTVEGTANALRSQSAALGKVGAGPVNRFTLGLNASWEIDLWGKNRALLQSALSEAEATRYDRDAVELTAQASTASTYFQILGAQDRKRIAAQNIESASRVLTIVRERLAAGTGTALDVAQQEAVVANLRAQVPPLDQEIEQDKATLAFLTGRAPGRERVAGGALRAIAIPAIRPGVPAQLLARRPDIAAAEARLEAAGANVAAARAAFFPSISLTGLGGIESLALKSLFGPGSTYWSIGAGLTQPIFEGWRLTGQLEQQRGRQEELLQLYRRAVMSAFADVERALVAVRNLAEQERLQQQAVESSRRAYQISEQRLREGTVDLVTLLATQQTLFQAEDALTRVRIARLLAGVGLFQALGGGWTVDKPRP
jgi:NodT family efflux transporter outer membrane factor (OMF) lipoprotein